ncbi:MAG: glycosyltransferase family 4 protein, partial [Thermogutta sp.]|nr:glycosyltransferase family 4 protein [Thermogutta sp.]
DGIRVVRVWTYLAPNAGTVRRILNYLSFMVSAVWAALRLPRPDVLVATSPQFFCGWAGVWVRRLRRVPFVLEIRDIWPDSIETVGAIRFRPLLRFLERLERRMYLAADHIVAVGEGYKRRILEKVDIPDRISVITNGVDLARFPLQPPDAELRRRRHGENKFVCAYVGTVGMAHGLEVVLDAADLLRRRGRDDVVFWLVGDGACRERLQAEAERRGLKDRVVFTGRQAKEDVPRVLASVDACLVHLRKTALFETVIPSKIFEMMAMARPIIMGVNGDAREITAQAGAAIAIEPESAESLAEAVVRLADDPALRGRLASSARDYVAAHYDRNRLAEEFLELLRAVAGESRDRAARTASACDLPDGEPRAQTDTETPAARTRP